MTTTLGGAIGSVSFTLNFDATGSAYNEAAQLVSQLESTYTTAVSYSTSHFHNPHAGILIVGDAVANSNINATGFGAIVVQNAGASTTVHGSGNQVVLASDGGLKYITDSGVVTVDAGGGNNLINLKNDTSGGGLIYAAGGNNTIYAGGGSTTISAGAGSNYVNMGTGATLDYVTGNDTVNLGGGADTIDVLAAGSAYVRGAASVSVSGFSLTFVGGNFASTVRGGAGSYSIFGGSGGGVFTGGAAGNNSILGGSGNVSIYGGGVGDTLIGGSGNNLIVAGTGNETLGGGATGTNIFELNATITHTAGGTTDTITDFGANDLLWLPGAGAIAQALNTYDVAGGNASFLLLDGTKVVLEGYTGTLGQSNFKH